MRIIDEINKDCCVPGVRVCHHFQRDVDRDLAVHREEPVHRVRHVVAAQRGQGHGGVDLERRVT